MWTSITNIDISTTFGEAIENLNKSNSVLFGGGTYLVSEKNNNINNLVDINGIIDKTIEVTEDSIIIGAGSSLQNIIDKLSDYKSLLEAAKYSCFSKNIRNQRTLGGEIARRQIQSEIFTYLMALNPILEIRTPKKNNVYLREWDGQGIINKIILNKIELKSSAIERFATLESAPAFVIVAVVRRALELDFVISGKAAKVYGQTINLADFSKRAMNQIINESVLFFDNDQYGTLEYKKSIITTGIQRAVEKI